MEYQGLGIVIDYVLLRTCLPSFETRYQNGA